MCSRAPWHATGGMVLALLGWATGWAQSPTTSYGIGRPASADETRAWGVTVGPDGQGLPEGGATAAEGRRVYLRSCARCHGPTGIEGPDDRLVGSQRDLLSESPRKTVGSYWPFATTLWDYINRAMPFDQPGALTVDEVYGSVAYVLFLNEIVGEQQRVDASSLPLVRMPNRDGFVEDPRPDVGDSSR